MDAALCTVIDILDEDIDGTLLALAGASACVASPETAEAPRVLAHDDPGKKVRDVQGSTPWLVPIAGRRWPGVATVAPLGSCHLPERLGAAAG